MTYNTFTAACRKFLSAVIGAAALAVLPSCLDEHVPVVDLSLRVGNVYCADGQIVPVDHFLTTDLTPVGVVVAVGAPEDSYRALVMGLEDLGDTHFLNTIQEEVSGVSADLTLFNGKENTAALLYAVTENEELNPGGALLAASYIAGGMSAWYLPSVAEFRSVAASWSAVSSTLAAIGAEPLGTRYQTSTVDGTSDDSAMLYNYCIELPKGNVTSTLKTEPHTVRPFLLLR